MADPYRYFRIEANELVGQLEQGAVELERAPDHDKLARLLRLAHTLKGAARIVKHTTLAALAHALEDALDPLRDTAGVGAITAADALIDRIASEVAALAALPPATTQVVPITESDLPPTTAPVASLPPIDERASDTAALPRVDPSLLDHLLGELGELHVQLATFRALKPELGELDVLDRGLRSVRRQAEQLRLLPVSTVLGSLERTARDAAHATGKQMRFASSGGDVRVDARVLTGLYGALVQLVRNAVVHGLEAPADRRAAGKPAVGTVGLEVRMHGDHVIVRCEDDGHGIDFAAVREAAIARGQLAVGADPGPDALIQILLRGGLSTARGITPLAGRGIGLDVVSDAARVLGGEVRVRSRPGAGTAITIEAPCAVISLACISVIAGEHTVSIPQAAVRRVTTVTRDDLAAGSLARSAAHDDARWRSLAHPAGTGPHADAACPLGSLARILGGTAGNATTAVVLSDGDAWAAVAIDRVIGLTHVVVRPLAESIPVSPLVRGVALDDAGVARPVLEPGRVIAAIARAPGFTAPAPARPPPILVVDDSLTTRTLEQSMLEAAGYDVDVAESAELGLERAAERAYGLYLVDVEMPGLDGFGFVSAIRARSQTPAVLVTSRDTPEDRRRGREVGAQGYLIKGALDQHELLSLVARLLT
jgi:two-component system chemotaxis sensor kinase CheA